MALHETSMWVTNDTGTSCRLVVEPWAEEHWLAPKERRRITASSPCDQPRLDLVISGDGLIVFVEGMEATFSLDIA